MHRHTLSDCSRIERRDKPRHCALRTASAGGSSGHAADDPRNIVFTACRMPSRRNGEACRAARFSSSRSRYAGASCPRFARCAYRCERLRARAPDSRGSEHAALARGGQKSRLRVFGRMVAGRCWETIAQGRNHVLPTYGYARAYSGRSVLRLRQACHGAGGLAEGVAQSRANGRDARELEGLDWHAYSVTRRLGSWSAHLWRPHELGDGACAAGHRGAPPPTSIAAWRPELEASAPPMSAVAAAGRTSIAGPIGIQEPQPVELIARLAALYDVAPRCLLSRAEVTKAI